MISPKTGQNVQLDIGFIVVQKEKKQKLKQTLEGELKKHLLVM